MADFLLSQISFGFILEFCKCFANYFLLILAFASLIVFSMMAVTRRRLSGSAARKSNLKSLTIASALYRSVYTKTRNVTLAN